MKKLVIALGGNALGNTVKEQKEACKIAAQAIVEFYKQGYSVAVCHGNGPQVGKIHKHMNFVLDSLPNHSFPLCEAVSLSQGYIGFHLQNAIKNESIKRDIDLDVVTLVSQTLVEKNDDAFNNPTKPIGSSYTKKKMQKLMKENGFDYKEISFDQWRRVVASPKPLGIIEEKILMKNLKNRVITIVGGGGGIPVIQDKNGFKGVDAVIDKDLTAAKIAEIIKADEFIILTAVDYVAINFNKNNHKNIKEMSLEEAEKHITRKEFGEGSMLPKIRAAISFVKLTGKPAYIGNLEHSDMILKGMSTKLIA